MFARGHVLAPADVVARRKGFHVMRAKRRLGGAELPLSVDLSPFVNGPGGPTSTLDQGPTGRCEGFAHAGGITTRFAIKGTPIPLVSPDGIYKVARCVGRRPGADGKLPALIDEGTESDLAIAGIQEWGVSSAATWGEFGLNPLTINDNPTLEQLEAASDFTLSGAYFITSDPHSDQYIVDLLTALAEGYPVAYALPASGDAFQGYAGNGPVAGLTGPVDHENYIVGCSIPSRGAYSQATILAVNSWGQWGRGGIYTLARSDIAKTADACVLDVVASTGATER